MNNFETTAAAGAGSGRDALVSKNESIEASGLLDDNSSQRQQETRSGHSTTSSNNFERTPAGTRAGALSDTSSAVPLSTSTDYGQQYGQQPPRGTGTDLDALTGGSSTGAHAKTTNVAEMIESYGGNGHGSTAAGSGRDGLVGSGALGGASVAGTSMTSSSTGGGLPDAQEGSILHRQSQGRLSSNAPGSGSGGSAGLGSADYGSAAAAGALGTGIVAGGGSAAGLTSSRGVTGAGIDSTNYQRQEPYSNQGLGAERFEPGSSDPTSLGGGSGATTTRGDTMTSSSSGIQDRSFNSVTGTGKDSSSSGLTGNTGNNNNNDYTFGSSSNTGGGGGSGTDFGKVTGVAGAGLAGGGAGAAAYAKKHGTGNEQADRLASQAPSNVNEAQQQVEQGKQTIKEKMEENSDPDGFVNASNALGRDAPGPFTGRVNPDTKTVETELKQRAPRDEQGRELDSYGKPYNV